MEHPLVREFSAKCIARVARQIREVFQNRGKPGSPPPGPGSEGLISLGLPALKGLYQAKRENRRWYDTDTTLQKAVTSLYSLPTEGLTVLSFKMSDLIGLISLYGYVCEQTAQEPLVEDLFRIVKSGLEGSPQDAEEMLSEILGKDLYLSFSREAD